MAIRDSLREWLAQRPEKVIAAFSSIPGEPSLLALIAAFPEKQWALPRIDGESLVFHFAGAAGLDGHQPGLFGIREPAADAPVCAIETIGIFLCPGMGFTRCGKRLGRGKGYYDRTLPHAGSEALRVGVCFREQIHPELPVDLHDMPMHFLATPDGVMECKLGSPQAK
jgi:5-formyltetrahydrofolate cyclo-ligase